jgi:predicted metalloprotease with PDZ domain
VLLWFARRVSQFSAQSNGVPLDWRKLDFQTWEIKPRSAGTVRVSFNYLADAVDRAVAWTAPNFAFFNGTNLFLYPEGRGLNWPARVSVRTEPSWRIVTGMDPAPGTNNFTAGNYHDLTDMPFYVSRREPDAGAPGPHLRVASEICPGADRSLRRSALPQLHDLPALGHAGERRRPRTPELAGG